MKTLSLDNDSWDLFLDEFGNISTKESKQQVSQDVASSCRTWKGEAYFDVNRGIPYVPEIMGERPRYSLIQAYMDREALRVPGSISTQVVFNQIENRTSTFDILTETDDREDTNAI